MKKSNFIVSPPTLGDQSYQVYIKKLWGNNSITTLAISVTCISSFCNFPVFTQKWAAAPMLPFKAL